MALDLTPYRELKIAPRAVFDRLAERATRPRFMVPAGNEWRAVTWGDFAGQIRRAALHLQAEGFAAGDRAAIFAPNRVEWMAAALAIQAAGGVMVPIYPSCTAEQMAYVALHSDARVLFVDTAPLLDRVRQVFGQLGGVERIVFLDDSATPADLGGRAVPWSRAQAIGAARDAEDPGAFDRALAAVSLDQPGLMLYTSGTSGNPKGVPLTHRNVAHNGLDWLECLAPALPDGDGDGDGAPAVDLLWLPMSHIFGLGEACIGNTLGWTTYLADPLSVVARLPEVRPSVLMSVPSVWEKLAQRALTAAPASDPAARRTALQQATGGELRFCLSGGAGLKREVKELFHDCGLLVIEGYGLTECSPTLTLNRPGAFRFDSVGRPLPSVDLQLAPDGEILARGPNVFAGYHKDPAATAEAFTADGWFKTGDVGRFTDDGFLQIIDRKKDILVTAGGKNVPPANIEIRFQDDPFIAHVVVYGEGKRYLTAGVWVNEAAVRAHLDAEGVGPDARGQAARTLVQGRIDRVNGELAQHETIKKFALMEPALSVGGGHLTATLKVRRKHVYAEFRDRFEALYEGPGAA